MIIEGLVTTRDVDGAMHVAPMGPMIADSAFDRFELRPFRTSQTLGNLVRDRFGVFHTSDDVLMLARAAIGRLSGLRESIAAQSGAGFVIANACAAFEFNVDHIDLSTERTKLTAITTRRHRFRDFIGFNRAKNAVLEAAILATRTMLIPSRDILTEFDRLRIIVAKTGGESELTAMEELTLFVQEKGEKRAGT